jgi:putative endonuclease
MHYVYILKLRNGQNYIGYTANIDDRIARHQRGEACKTTERISFESLEFYAAFRSERLARVFEKYLKSSSGFAFRNKRLIEESPPACRP